MLPFLSAQKPVLIIDKHGLLSSALLVSVAKHQLVILITNAHLPRQKHIIALPYGNRIPRIPNNLFSAMMVIDADLTDLKLFSPSLLAKAKESNCRLWFVNSIYSLTLPFLQQYGKIAKHASLLLYSDILSDERAYPNRAQQILVNCLKKEKVVLPQTGVNVVYPVLEKDVVQQIDDLLRNDAAPFAYCLFPQMGITELTLARMLTQHDPDSQIILKEKGPTSPELLLPSHATFLCNNQYPLKEKLLTLSHQKVKDLRAVSSAGIYKQRPKNGHMLRYILGGLSFVVVLFLIPFLLSAVGLLSLKQSIHLIENGQSSQAIAFARLSQDFFQVGDTSSWPLRLSSRLIALEPTVDSWEDKLYVGIKMGDVLASVADSMNQLQANGANANKVTGALADIKFASEVIQQLDAEGKLSFFPDAQLSQLRHMTNMYTQLYPFLPSLLGTTIPQKYLLLFLNSNELRPGGGFIGSYGEMTLQDGKYSDLSVHDVYDADGQLQGHVEPPRALKEYLGAQNWFLRDSNFSLDPSENANLESYFYHLETQQTPQAVISVDTYLIQDLLNLIGAVYLPDYQQTVTADNFFELTQDHAEKNFFPGSTQKKTFLSSLYQSIQAKLKDHPLSPKAIYSFVLSEMQEKHLIVNSLDPNISAGLNNTFLGSAEQDLVWNGADGEVVDFFGMNEANLGANKVNHYLTRSFSHTVHIDSQGGVTHTASIAYTNTSTKENSYGGDYKVYLRALIPSSANLISISFDGVVQPFVLSDQPTNSVYKGKGIRPTPALAVDKEVVAGKSSYGFFTTIPQSKSVIISVSYTLARSFSNTEQPYILELYKQPGTDKDGVQIRVQTDQPYTLRTSQQGFSSSTSVSQGKMVLDTDQQIRIQSHK